MTLGKMAALCLGPIGIIALRDLDPAGAQGSPACSSLSGGRVSTEVVEVVAEELRMPPIRVRPETRLAEDLGADELGQLEVVMGLERRFGIRIDERVERPARDVRGLVEQVTVLLRRRCGG